MKPPVIVADTNLLVAGLLTRDNTAPTARILNLLLDGEIRFLLSIELLSEYREVLQRPKISMLHGLAPRQIDSLLESLVLESLFRNPQKASLPPAPDPTDQHVWDLARTVSGCILVTGDKRLLASEDAGFPILTPRGFVELLEL